ncbi:class I SAM-dependent methyltransferase [Oceanicoccus sp. KOV_DT_Chl]|uniref:class I SAM-dependent methyltransferase n=1 Tax=Oceanicoccus sp. KOV_DT_Chl TaxID=1904639 RepID=UPI000C7E1095|nr:class I SAM-dependent methyltransferase [Oceanicoccus sp. KOV_DT_Chl]
MVIDKSLEAMQQGIALQQSGQLAQAILSYQKALKLNAKNPLVLYFLGVALQETGKLEEAVNSYKKAVALNPDYVDAHYSLGNVFKARGELDSAVSSFQRVISIKPDFIKVHNSLGTVLQKQGKLKAAAASYQKTIALKADHFGAYYNLGNVRQEQGDLDAAVTSYKKAIAIKPKFAEAYTNLGAVLQFQNKLEEAIVSHKKAIELKPDFANAYYNLGTAQMDAGKYELAFFELQHAVTIEPNKSTYWNSLALCVEKITIDSYHQDLEQLFLRMLDQPIVLPKRVMGTITNMLFQHPNFISVLEFARTDDLENNLQEAITQLTQIPLFLKILELSPNQNLDGEMMLSGMRSAIINSWDERTDDPNRLLFCISLAHQCFINEYVYIETPQETFAVNKIIGEVERFLEEKRPIPPVLIAILGCYRPLYTFSWAKSLLEFSWPNKFLEVIKSQISEPLEEQAIRPTLPSMTTVENVTSMAVRDQYEDNPYPRWTKAGLGDEPKAVAQALKVYAIDLSNYKSPAQPRILIAGCGTGHQALQAASRYADSHILAVDLSLSSLSYALRKTKELQFNNIEYMQGDILELGSCGRDFDLIECRGVLHHLKEPLVGWQVLVDLLRKGGIMKIGLYSKIARRQVIAAREMISELGYDASRENIRQFRQELITMSRKPGSEVDSLVGSEDFFSLSDCRDLLFHVQEHQFTLPEIELILKDLGLQFLGFEINNNHTMSNFKELNQEKNSLVSLSRWHDFELQNPYTFGNMYEFWVKKI